jgi:hypothetical protein
LIAEDNSAAFDETLKAGAGDCSPYDRRLSTGPTIITTIDRARPLDRQD